MIGQWVLYDYFERFHPEPNWEPPPLIRDLVLDYASRMKMSDAWPPPTYVLLSTKELAEQLRAELSRNEHLLSPSLVEASEEFARFEGGFGGSARMPTQEPFFDEATWRGEAWLSVGNKLAAVIDAFFPYARASGLERQLHIDQNFLAGGREEAEAGYPFTDAGGDEDEPAAAF